MGDSEKPFACSSPGCNMSFANEDHLVVHKKKHDMVLNLGNNGKATFVADQTPTPTRFIRNCEEVGLFQDLQNVNPFEETFRRAVEDGKTGALSESEIGHGNARPGSTDDALHTPRIFPNTTESTETAASDESTDSAAAAANGSRTSLRRDIGETVAPERSRDPPDSEELAKRRSDGIVVREADTSAARSVLEPAESQQNLCINGQEVELLLKTADGKVMRLSAVPVCENRNERFRIGGTEDRGDALVKNRKKNSSGSNSRLALAKMRLKESLTKSIGTASPEACNSDDPETSRNTRREKISGKSEQRQKLDVLARNRASSMRARAKRKAWIQQLQRTTGIANEKNAALQLEVEALRSEVARLRTLLVAHENCPVSTGSMGRGSLVAPESTSFSIVETAARNIHGHQPDTRSRRKAVGKSCETPIAPRMPKVSQHAPILPKIEPTRRDLVVLKDPSALKIVNVRTLPGNDKAWKKIFCTKNPGEKVGFVTTISREPVPLYPATLPIENAASKCTGT